MASGRNTLMDPPIEDLLDKVDSKFTLVALGSIRARQVNAYYNSLGEGLGKVVPPQVTSVSGKPLSIAFEEIAAGKATYTRPDPEAEAEAAALAAAEEEVVAAAGLQVVEIAQELGEEITAIEATTEIEIDAVEEAAAAETAEVQADIEAEVAALRQRAAGAQSEAELEEIAERVAAAEQVEESLVEAIAEEAAEQVTEIGLDAEVLVAEAERDADAEVDAVIDAAEDAAEALGEVADQAGGGKASK